jgi:hypothetical protein
VAKVLKRDCVEAEVGTAPAKTGCKKKAGRLVEEFL